MEGQGEDISDVAAAEGQMELNAQAGGGGGPGEDGFDGGASGGQLKTTMNKIAGKS
jgi:hypothetical protein